METLLDNKLLYEKKTADGELIVRVYLGAGDEALAYTLADELLEAVKAAKQNIIEWHEFNGSDHRMSDSPLLRQINRVITKAGGQQ